MFEGPSTPKETPPPDYNEGLESYDDNDHGREEGEVCDDDNDHHSSNDIYETEEAIMREWAPTVSLPSMFLFMCITIITTLSTL